MTSGSIIDTNLHKPNNKLVSAWLKHFLCTDKPWTYTNSQNSPRPKLREATTSPLKVLFVISHEGYIQMSFCLKIPKLGVPKFPKLGLLALWRPITSCVDLQLKWVLKQSCNPCQELSNGMWHATFMQVNQLVVGSQIDNLTHGPSFGHNLCFKYPNGSCELILDIYIPRDFQWYNELFNPMSFDPLKSPSKVSKIH
jgi:hypothetical protein